MSYLQTARHYLAEAVDLSPDAFQISLGLGVMLLVVVAFRKSFADWRPLAAVALAAVAGTLWGGIDAMTHGATPHWSPDGKAVWNMMFWPAVLFGLARFTRVLKR